MEYKTIHTTYGLQRMVQAEAVEFYNSGMF